MTRGVFFRRSACLLTMVALAGGCATGPDPAQQNWASCKKDVGPFYKSLLEVDARLSAGLQYDELQKRVGDVYSVHNQMPRVADPCYTKIYKPLYAVFVHYQKGQEAWRVCIEKEGFDCDPNKAGEDEFASATRGLTKIHGRWDVANEGTGLPD